MFRPINSHSIKNKVAIVTGASSGIGRSFAIELAKQGAKVVIASRREDVLQQVASEIKKSGGEVLPVATDIRDINSCNDLIKKTVNTYKQIDILINNAGVSMRATFEDLDLKVIRELMDTNFYGMVYCSKAALPYLLKSKGTIVGISSITGLTPLPGRTGYAASKHAMDGFLNTLRLETRHKGLNVIVAHPGFTNSNIRFSALNKEGKAQGETPRIEEKMMSSEKVAHIIVKAIQKRKRNLTMTAQGKAVVWVYNNFPRIADYFITRAMAKEPNSPTKE